MCGIAGVWGDVTAARLDAMTECLRHRGPDDAGSWIDKEVGIGLAYRRLAIIDLAEGRQPFANETGQMISVCNGEIYNYRELREGLIARGHRLRSQADTEVIVHLYEEEGLDVALKLRGMFAIAIWDGTRQQLVLIRDRVGKKPLFYSEIGDEFVFASELKGLLPALQSTPDIDQQSIADFLTFGMIPAPATVYQGIRSVEPAERVVIRQGRVASREKYWRLQMLPKLDIEPEEAIERLNTELQEAVRLRLRSDVPVGCFLSGGIDSGIITAMASQQCSGRLTTLTVGFNDDAFDERPLARRVAQRYDTDHHEISIRPDIAADLPTIIRTYDQPFGDSSSIPSYYIAREARKHVKVVLNGDGGDEILAGYRRYVAGWMSNRISRLDGEARRPYWRRLLKLLPVPQAYRSRYAFVHRLVRGMGLDPVARYLAWTYDGLDDDNLRALCKVDPLNDRGNWLDGVESSERLGRKALEPFSQCGVIDSLLGADFELMLPNDFLVKIDMATMAHGLEARSPLLDQTLVELVSRFPERIKLNGWTTKPLLRELSRRYLPEEISKAPKRGFEVPLVRWLRGDLSELAHDVLLQRNGLLSQLFDRSALEQLLLYPNVDPARWSRWIWLLMTLGMWDRVVYSAQ